jgi:Trk-type K+ transport system membrane component
MTGTVRPLALARLLGGLLMLFAPAFLLPLGWSLLVDDGCWRAFLSGAVASLLIGLVLWGMGRVQRIELQPRDACLLVVAGWIACALVATVPLQLLLKMQVGKVGML